MRRFFAALPGPLPLKLALVVLIVAALLVMLFFLFEWAGNLLDSGGVVGPAG